MLLLLEFPFLIATCPNITLQWGATSNAFFFLKDFLDSIHTMWSLLSLTFIDLFFDILLNGSLSTLYFSNLVITLVLLQCVDCSKKNSSRGKRARMLLQIYLCFYIFYLKNSSTVLYSMVNGKETRRHSLLQNQALEA